MWIGLEYSYAWFGYHTVRSFLCLYQVDLFTGQYFRQAINVKSLMITDSRASEASRCMFVKPLIIAQLYYPSSNIFVKSTYCKIHDRDWFQPRLDLHNSNAQTSKRWLAYQRNRITDQCVCVQSGRPWKGSPVTWGKCWHLFSVKIFLPVRVAVGWEAKQRRCSGHRGLLRCSSHWETEIVPARSRVLSRSFLVNIGLLRTTVCDLCSNERYFPIPLVDDSRLPIILLSVLAMSMQGIYSYCSCLPDACLTNTQEYYSGEITCIWLVATVVHNKCIVVTRAMLTSIWSK